MTESEKRALIAQTESGLENELDAAFERYREQVRAGVAPRDAVQAVMDSFIGDFQDTMREAFGALLVGSVGSAAAEPMTVDVVSLSQSLYRNADRAGLVVQGLADAHARGFQDARKLALELFEGYGFRDTEVLQLSPRNESLPKYLREALLSDDGLAGELQRLFARMQGEKLKTEALKAAYLEALDALESGKGQDVLEKKMRIAVYERMRYYATRIARTELARAYTDRQSTELMEDDATVFVQIRMSQRHPQTDICDAYARVDRYGLGPGVYPKAQAPRPPFHPHCMCVVSPRLDISPRAQYRERPDAEQAYLTGLDESDAARVAGSRDKLAEALTGTRVTDIWNRSTDPNYRITTVGLVAAKRAQ